MYRRSIFIKPTSPLNYCRLLLSFGKEENHDVTHWNARIQLIHLKRHTNMEDKNMKSRWISLIVFLSFTILLFSLAPKSLPNLQGSSAWGDEDRLPFPKNATFTTQTL